MFKEKLDNSLLEEKLDKQLPIETRYDQVLEKLDSFVQGKLDKPKTRRNSIRSACQMILDITLEKRYSIDSRNFRYSTS